jgi:hypothetical protein
MAPLVSWQVCIGHDSQASVSVDAGPQPQQKYGDLAPASSTACTLRYVGVRLADSEFVDGPPPSAHDEQNRGSRTIGPALRAGRASRASQKPTCCFAVIPLPARGSGAHRPRALDELLAKHCSSQTSAWSGMARDGGGGRMAQLVSFPLHPRIRRRARRLSKPSQSVRFFGMSRDGMVRLICSHPNLCVGVAAPGAAHRTLAWSSWSPSRPRETDPLLQVGLTAPGWGGWNDSDLLIHGSRKPLTL